MCYQNELYLKSKRSLQERVVMADRRGMRERNKIFLVVLRSCKNLREGREEYRTN